MRKAKANGVAGKGLESEQGNRQVTDLRSCVLQTAMLSSTNGLTEQPSGFYDPETTLLVDFGTGNGELTDGGLRIKGDRSVRKQGFGQPNGYFHTHDY
ncbi:MAG: hypothetical protein SQA66_11455 [Candidatus Fervidibacter sacchari]